VCTNFTPTQRAPWVKAKFGVDLPAGYPEESYPGFASPIVVQSQQTGRVACGLARFGLIPAWAKDNKIARHTYNARSETVAEKPSFRDAWRRAQHCIIPVDAFFEPDWRSGKAVPTRIRAADGQPLGVAGLWSWWKNPATGEPLHSFTLLTINADPHPLMQQFHKPGEEKRMIVILPPDRYDDWLQAGPKESGNFLQPYPAEALVAERPGDASASGFSSLIGDP